MNCMNYRYILSVLVSVCLTVPTYGQPVSDKTSSRNGVQITKADAVMLGRGVGTESMFVGYQISFCIAGVSRESTTAKSKGLRVRFASRYMTDVVIRDERLVQGSLSLIQEPLDGKSERCSRIDFQVNADAVVGLRILDEPSNPQILLEGGLGSELLTSRQVSQSILPTKAR
jgi:hypothetical protein